MTGPPRTMRCSGTPKPRQRLSSPRSSRAKPRTASRTPIRKRSRRSGPASSISRRGWTAPTRSGACYRVSPGATSRRAPRASSRAANPRCSPPGGTSTRSTPSGLPPAPRGGSGRGLRRASLQSTPTSTGGSRRTSACTGWRPTSCGPTASNSRRSSPSSGSSRSGRTAGSGPTAYSRSKNSGGPGSTSPSG